MPTPEPIDPVRAALRAGAHHVLAQLSSLQAQGLALRQDTITVADGRLVLTVTLSLPSERLEEDRELDACERDLLALLQAAACRWPTNRVLAEASKRGLPYSEATIRRRLARLVRRGLACSSSHAPRGYYLPGKPCPLFPDHA
jgi:hypothetical protein